MSRHASSPPSDVRRTRSHRRRAGTIATAAAMAAGMAALLAPAAHATDSTPGDIAGAATSVLSAKANCIYPANSLATLASYEKLTAKTYNCVLFYNDAKPTWADWVHPWVLHPPSADANLAGWKTAEPGRRLIISQPMVPDDAPANWRVLGAQGAYDGYARQLAQQLVAGGLGNSIVRLGWEANGNFNIENELGNDPSQYRDWATYWANIVRTMRAVPGAHFLFDWTINQYYRPIPLADWYPGNDVVDIIGIDAYDSGVPSTPTANQQRYNALSTQTDGLDAIAAFAQAHDKPISIPEWGLVQPGSSEGAGDDPAYIHGLAHFIDTHRVAYNSYFVSGPGEGLLYLPQAPASLTAYKHDFTFGAARSSHAG